VLIDGLYRASRAGVPIDLVVRGLCCLRPGIPDLSETIRVRSLVGQFLEHSRIFRFGGGDEQGPEADASPNGSDARPPLRLLIGSADMMERNLDRRIEVLVPVADPELQARLLEILDLVLHDDTNSWSLGADRRWRRVPSVEGLNAQQRLKELALGRARRRRAPEAQAAPAGPS